MIFFPRARRLALLSPLAAAAAVAAQPAAVPAHPAEPARSVYRSTFEGYQPFDQQNTADWKASNDTVGRIGGWRAYAREAAQEDAPAAQPARAGHAPSAQAHEGHRAAPVPAQAPAGPPATSRPDPHAGHGRHP